MEKTITQYLIDRLEQTGSVPTRQFVSNECRLIEAMQNNATEINKKRIQTKLNNLGLVSVRKSGGTWLVKTK